MRNDELHNEILIALYGTIYAPDSSMEGEVVPNRSGRVRIENPNTPCIPFRYRNHILIAGLEG